MISARLPVVSQPASQKVGLVKAGPRACNLTSVGEGGEQPKRPWVIWPPFNGQPLATATCTRPPTTRWRPISASGIGWLANWQSAFMLSVWRDNKRGRTTTPPVVQPATSHIPTAVVQLREGEGGRRTDFGTNPWGWVGPPKSKNSAVTWCLWQKIFFSAIFFSTFLVGGTSPHHQDHCWGTCRMTAGVSRTPADAPATRCLGTQVRAPFSTNPGGGGC